MSNYQMEIKSFNYFGTVFLNQNHVIDNVLYILCFNFNLLLVAKLINSLSCILTFDFNGCHIQDKNSLKIIGSAKMQDKLYILRIPSYQKLQIKPIKYAHTINIVNVSPNDLKTLWHFRLGHVSNKCIDVIVTKFHFVKKTKSFVCDVCHFAKQKDFHFLLVHLNLKLFWIDSCRCMGVILNTINSWL